MDTSNEYTNKIINLYFKYYNLAYNNIKNYDQMLENLASYYSSINKEIYNKDGIKINLRFIKFKTEDINNIPEERKNISYYKNNMEDYNLNVYITPYIEVKDSKTNKLIVNYQFATNKKILVANIPLLVKSKYCYLNKNKINNEYLDFQNIGGFFIRKGLEKALVCDEKGLMNNINVFIKHKYTDLNDYEIIALYRYNVNIFNECEIETLRLKWISSKHITIFYNKIFGVNNKEINFLFLLFIFLKKIYFNINDLMDILEDYEITKCKYGIEMSYKDFDFKIYKNLDIIIKHVCETFNIDDINHLLCNHTPNNRKYILIMMLKELFKCYITLESTNRDYTGIKRYNNNGDIIFKSLAYSGFKMIINKLISELEKLTVNLKYKTQQEHILLVNKILEDIFINWQDFSKVNNKFLISGFNKHKWDFNPEIKCYVKYMEQKRNNIHFLISIRRCSASVNKDGSKIYKPREIDTSNFGLICPIETPENKSIGINKSFAIGTIISPGICINYLKKRLSRFKTLKFDISLEDYKNTYTIFLNHIVYAFCDLKTFEDILNYCKKYKKSNSLFKFISVYPIKKSLYFYSDRGRLLQPFIYLQNGKLPDITNIKSINQFQQNGHLEFLDKIEEKYLYNNKIVINLDEIDSSSTHVMLHPSLILGIGNVCTNFINYNHIPRNIFQANLVKQACLIRSEVCKLHTNNGCENLSSMILQQPIFSNGLLKLLNLHKYHIGENVMVMLKLHSGHNQEDSIIVSEEFVNSGHMEIEKIKEYNLEISCKKHKNNSKHLGENYNDYNIIKSGKILYNLDYIYNTNGNCVQYISNFIGYVIYSNFITDYKYKIVINTISKLELGDKIASTQSQKGVINKIEKYYNLPYDNSGMRPSIIINSNTIISRMTYGFILEGYINHYILNSKNCYTSKNTHLPFDKIELDENYFSKLKRIFYNPISGEELGNCFCFPINYQRLKQFACDKINIRNLGLRNNTLRQSYEGKNNGGGLRFGRMEITSLGAHSAPFVLHERLSNSDTSYVSVCKNCKNICLDYSKLMKNYCQFCGNNDIYNNVSIPFSTYILHTMQLNFGINMKFEIE